MKLHVAKEEVCDRMFKDIQTNLDFYADGGCWEFEPQQLLPAALNPGDGVPGLVAPKPGKQATAQEEFDNSVRVFEWLGPMRPIQARDRRLWLYLSHAVFADYTRQRWPVPDDEEPTKRIDSVRSHWFVTGGLAGARRHSLARLWWGAALTVRDGEEDPWRYTRILYLNQDIYQGLMERLYGTNRALRHAVLEVLLRREAEISSKAVTTFLKHLNYVAQWRLLPALDDGGLVSQLDELWVRSNPLEGA